MRIDADAPLVRGKADAEHLKASATTLNYLAQHHAKVVVVGHLSRPAAADTTFSLLPVAQGLANILGKSVRFVDSAIGPKAAMAIKRAPAGSIIMLENLRFYSGEEANDPQFALQLQRTTGADYFVQDDRRAVRHAWASTDAINHIVPGFAGFNVMDIWGGPGVKSLLDA